MQGESFPGPLPRAYAFFAETLLVAVSCRSRAFPVALRHVLSVFQVCGRDRAVSISTVAARVCTLSLMMNSHKVGLSLLILIFNLYLEVELNLMFHVH